MLPPSTSSPRRLDILRERGLRDVREADLSTIRDSDGYDNHPHDDERNRPAGNPRWPRPVSWRRHPVCSGATGAWCWIRARWNRRTRRRPPPPAVWPDVPTAYVGEAWISIEFDGERGTPFRELYVDHTTLEAHAARAGWRSSLVFHDEHGAYTAVLQPPR